MIIDQIIHYLYIGLAMFIATIVILGGLLIYLLKVKKITAKTEKIDYQNFRREDAQEYVKFEDIISEDPENMKSPGMIALGNYTYVGGISVSGFNFPAASGNEKERTMINSITFFNRVEERIQMRQTVKAVDLGHNIEVYKGALERLVLEHDAINDDYKTTVQAAEDYMDYPEQYKVYEKQILKMQRTLQSKEHEIEEVRWIIKYMNAMIHGDASEAQKINQIIFSYTFDPSEYTEEQSEETIRLKAFNALMSKANSYSEGLINCGCTCRMLSAYDFVDLIRKQTQPLTSDELKLEQMLDASYTTLFITSDSLIDFEKERIGEEAYERQMKQLQQIQKENARRLAASDARSKAKLQADVRKTVPYAEGIAG